LGPVTARPSSITAFSVFQVTMEITSPLFRLAAIAKQVCLSIAMASPSIEPEVSSTRVTLMGARASAVIASLLMPTCTRYSPSGAPSGCTSEAFTASVPGAAAG
jgi:hypothetical protein